MMRSQYTLQMMTAMCCSTYGHRCQGSGRVVLNGAQRPMARRRAATVSPDFAARWNAAAPASAEHPYLVRKGCGRTASAPRVTRY